MGCFKHLLLENKSIYMYRSLRFIIASLFLISGLSSEAQVDCIDPNLIDPDGFCTMEYNPVCGCNGITYSNPCLAEITGGVTSYTFGECIQGGGCIDQSQIDVNVLCPEVWSPVCGCDGITYSSECVAYYYAGVTSFTNGECIGDCIDPNQIDINVLCPDVWSPVCGCDGITYSNECAAYYYGGVTDFTVGECGGGDCIDPDQIDLNVMCPMIWAPVCGCDGITYSNECVAYYHAGLTSFTVGECGGGGCIDQEQIDFEVFCPAVWDPVCGCDGLTYGNECEAYNWGGVTSWTMGECGGGVICFDLAEADFGDCEMYLGIGLINGECTPLSGCGTIDIITGNDMAQYIFEDYNTCYSNCSQGGCYDMGNADFGLCDMALGIGLVNGSCVSISGCSTVDYNSGMDLVDYFFDSYAQCQISCGLGDCVDLIGVNFGPCDAIIGVANINGSCSYVSGCSQTDVNEVDYSPYFFDNMESCVSICGAEECQDDQYIDISQNCFGLFNAVCGCDQATYPSSCVALYYYGITEWEAGPCGDVLDCFNPVQVDLNYPCPENLDPVCGCNNVQYDNPCSAYYYGGLQSWEAGPCENNISESELIQKAFPNPTASVFTLQLKNVDDYTIDIYAMDGRLIDSRQFNGQSQIELDVSTMSAGIYHVNVSGTKGKYAFLRMMVQ